MNQGSKVAILFCHRSSHYRFLDVEVYDAGRNALSFRGGSPVVAHPPCRMWSRARRRDLVVDHSEADLAVWAVGVVRSCGGVLEHPFCSRLWSLAGLPGVNCGGVDEWGGWTMRIDQQWFGHVSEKSTWLYVVGLPREDVPAVHFRPALLRARNFNHLGRRQRELTPLPLCRWLVEIAGRCRPLKPGCRGRPEALFPIGHLHRGREVVFQEELCL